MDRFNFDNWTTATQNRNTKGIESIAIEGARSSNSAELMFILSLNFFATISKISNTNGVSASVVSKILKQ